MNKNIFENLFVLEVANNHWGKVERGIKIIEEFGRIVRFNNVRAALKLQFRDVDSFIHKDFLDHDHIRYISKTKATKLSREDYGVLVKAVVNSGCIPMATPFDEKSVDLCVFFDMPIIKIASSDINDWPLIERIAHTRRPTIVSTGGSSLKDMDDIVSFFEKRNIPLAINHCVSQYPSEDRELELNQIDFMKNRYPGHVIGFSTHEYHDWSSSIMMAYAKGARTFERHVDIEMDGIPVSSYCSLPQQVDTWFKAFHKASEMCGAAGIQKRIPSEKETKYLDALVRGVYAKRDLPKGYKLNQSTMHDDIYTAIPLQKGQISCRELMSGETLLMDVKKDAAIKIHMIDTVYAENPSLQELINERGI
ncbi:MAG: N-acetylneuraminate synthase family protein [Coxiellaceae bacterium]|nr:N-acetylneuraminate synthase family protein [Coxiellaceae bacterium]